jgi:hypothetical protein
MKVEPRSDLDDGIFNVVVSVCQYYGQSVGTVIAREYVATYLDKMAQELRTLNEQETQR